MTPLYEPCGSTVVKHNEGGPLAMGHNVFIRGLAADLRQVLDMGFTANDVERGGGWEIQLVSGLLFVLGQVRLDYVKGYK